MMTSRRTFLRQIGGLAGSLAFFPANHRALADATAALPRSTAAAAGVDAAGIHAFLDALAEKRMELHSFMLLRHGRVAAEGWWAPYGPEFRHTLYSLSKSFTSTAIGMLVADGKLSVEEKVASIFPEALPTGEGGRLAEVRVKDLLTMSVGHAKDPTSEMVKSDNWLRTFLAWPVEHAPGTRFVYNSGATYALSAIVQKRSGKTLLEFLRGRLFEPLGIANATWETCPRGICTGGWGLSVTTEALAKFGELYLRKGQWNGRELLPASWIAEATAKQIQQPGNNEKSDWQQGYGYQFWRCRHGAFRGDGAFGQYIVVMPEQDAVFVATAEVSNMQAELDLVWEHLLPALKPAPLPDDPAAEKRLRERLAGLSLTPPAGIANPGGARINGKTARFEKNALGIESVEFAMQNGNCAFTFRDGDGSHRVVAEFGAWSRGEFALAGTPPRLVSGGAPKSGTLHPVSASAAWTDANTLTLMLRFHETPHHDRFVFRFDGDKVGLSFSGSIVALNAGKDSRPQLTGTLG